MSIALLGVSPTAMSSLFIYIGAVSSNEMENPRSEQTYTDKHKHTDTDRHKQTDTVTQTNYRRMPE